MLLGLRKLPLDYDPVFPVVSSVIYTVSCGQARILQVDHSKTCRSGKINDLWRSMTVVQGSRQLEILLDNFLPPASAVEVIESVPFVCLSVCVSVS